MEHVFVLGPTIGPDTWLAACLELHDWTEEPDHDTLPIAERMEIGYALVSLNILYTQTTERR